MALMALADFQKRRRKRKEKKDETDNERECI